MSEGELKRRIIQLLEEGTFPNRFEYIGFIEAIIDEAKKEFPSKPKVVNGEPDFTAWEDDVIAWFKKWYGEQK